MNYTTYEVRVSKEGSKFWRNENKQVHNEYGPAIEWFDGDKWYYLNGKMYTREEWKKEVNKNKSKAKELTVSEVSKLLGFEVKIIK